MSQHSENISVDGIVVLLLFIFNALIAKIAFIVNENFYWALIVTLPLLAYAIYEHYHKRQNG
ncbi:MAG: hypothetical protein ABIQ31_02320 [Ferruginibacter sp.]